MEGHSIFACPELAEVGAPLHLEVYSKIFLVLWNNMPPEGTNMYPISVNYTH